MDAATDLLGTREAAAHLGVERSTLSRWVKEGRLPLAQQLPGPTGAHLFRRADLDTLKATLAKAEA